MTWLNVMEYMSHKWPRICSVCHNHNWVLSSFMTYHRRVPHVEQEQLILPEFFPLFFTCLNGVRVFPFGLFNLCYLYWFKYTGVQRNFHIRSCSRRSAVTLRILAKFSEYHNSWSNFKHSGLSWRQEIIIMEGNCILV